MATSWAALYLGLLLLAVAGILGDAESRPAFVQIGLRTCVFLGVLAALGLLSLSVVTLHFYNNLDPTFEEQYTVHRPNHRP